MPDPFRDARRGGTKVVGMRRREWELETGEGAILDWCLPDICLKDSSTPFSCRGSCWALHDVKYVTMD